MREPVLNGKIILAVDDEPDFLTSLETKILQACPKCYFDKVTTYEKAVEMMLIWTYDLILLNATLPRGFDLLERAIIQRGETNFPVVIVMAHIPSAEALAVSFKKGINAYMPKDGVEKIVPALEKILRYENLSGLGRVIENLRGFLDGRRENGTESEAKFLQNFLQNMDELKRNGLY
jgi:CheY-like chemotaxis protein